MINKVITPEQKAALIEFNRAIIAQYESYAVPEAGWPDEVRLLVSSARIALASLTAEPVASCMVENGQMCMDGFGECFGENVPLLPDGNHDLFAAPPAPALRLPGRVSCDGFNEKEPDEARNLGQCEGWNAYQAEALRQNATAPQPVEMPKPERLDGNGYGYYFDMDDVFVALDKAGVKYQVAE